MCKNEYDASLALVDKATGNVWNVGQNWREPAKGKNWREPAPNRKAVSFWQRFVDWLKRQ